jgi:rubrerythrin
MSFIKGRLRRLEERSHGGRCQECGLRPQDNGYIVVDDNDPAGHIPEVCPECGRSTKLHIRVVYEGEEGEGDT